MIRALFIFAFFFAAVGCASYTYTHTDYSTDGKTPAHVYQVNVWRNAMDANAAAVHVELADGSKLDLAAGNETVDAGVVAAFTNVFQTIAGLGALALKIFGL